MYSAIIFIGPGKTSFGRRVSSPEYSQWLKKNFQYFGQVKIIGDGKSPIDYVRVIQELNNSELIKPDTNIYVDAYGSVKGGKHYMKLGDLGGAGDWVSSTAFLDTLQKTVRAYGGQNYHEKPWWGAVTLNSDYSGQVLAELDTIEQSGGAPAAAFFLGGVKFALHKTT